MLERGLAFLTRDGSLESAERYLSGKVRAKLHGAEALAEGDGRYRRNVEALKAVVPADEIKVRLVATWIPENVYSNFATEMIGGGSGWAGGHRVPAVTVRYIRQVYKFFVEINDAYVRSRPENLSTWGTKDRPFVGGQQNILEAALTNRTIAVWRTVGDSRRMGRQATAAAQEKLEQVLSEFQTWLWKDEGRRAELVGLDDEAFETESATVGGWTLEMFGTYPKEGQSFKYENLTVTVLKMDGLRVEKVLVQVHPEKKDDGG